MDDFVAVCTSLLCSKQGQGGYDNPFRLCRYQGYCINSIAYVNDYVDHSFFSHDDDDENIAILLCARLSNG